ncbi:MAG TPA: homoserine dehydrogenase [Terriglobia bacterium]|nr:homoserine dehydrogenase [Terriglobia bacterium]
MKRTPQAQKQPRAAGASRPVGLGIIGVGTVGTGTIKVLQEHQAEIERRLGCRLQLKMICSRSIHSKDFSWIRSKPALTTDWKEVVHNPAVDIVVELVGKLPTARAIAFAAVNARKHLVTANKQLVAEHGIELVGRSLEMGVKLGIEACVAGGTPILHAIRSGLAGESFAAVYGILNGTTNYILTEMEQRGVSFTEALADAQKLGYAEPDPTFDVEGFDARYKIAILTMVCFGQAVPVDEIPVEGITRIEQVDFAYAHRLNRTIRLIAAARRQRNRKLEISVRPIMIPQSSQLANVWGSTNGILLLGNKGGTTTLTGRGAGGEPTGVAVLSDVVEIARVIATGGSGSTPLGYSEWHRDKIGLPAGELVSSYLRLVVRDHPGILARVCAALGRHRINIDSVLQEPAMPKKHLPFVMTLEPTAEARVRAAAREIARLPFLVQPPLLLPFVDLP